MLTDLLSRAGSVATLIFVVSSMLAMGTSLSVAQIIEPLRNIRLQVLALLSNFVLMPLVAFILGKALRLDQSYAIGLLIMGCSAGAPFLPKLAQFAKGNIALAVGVMVLLMAVTVGYLPIVLPRLLEGATVDPWKIARSLILFMLLPLAAGLALKAYYGQIAARAKPVLDRISNISLYLAVLLISAANFDKVIDVFGSRAILSGMLFIALGFGIGWVLGGGSDTRRVLALGTAQRNGSAALVVAGQSFSDPKVLVMVTIVVMVNMLILMPVSRALGKR